MKTRLTSRGYRIIDFNDISKLECSIQESAQVIRPALWIGRDIGRMHVDKRLAKRLIKILKFFVKNDELPGPHDEVDCVKADYAKGE